jgi:hypothetical protein
VRPSRFTSEIMQESQHVVYPKDCLVRAPRPGHLFQAGPAPPLDHENLRDTIAFTIAIKTCSLSSQQAYLLTIVNPLAQPTDRLHNFSHSIVLALVLSPKGGTRTRKGIDMLDHERLDVYRGGLEFAAWAYGHCRCIEGAEQHARANR